MPFIIDADESARTIVDGSESHRTEIVFPFRMAVTMKVARLMPVRLWSAITTRISNPAAK